MGRYVLLEFADDDKADDFVTKLQARGGVNAVPRGLFLKAPLKRCECLGPSAENYREREQKGKKFRMHKKWGVWYCADCKRIRPGSYNPKNLLEDGVEINARHQLFMGGDNEPLPRHPIRIPDEV